MHLASLGGNWTNIIPLGRKHIAKHLIKTGEYWYKQGIGKGRGELKHWDNGNLLYFTRHFLFTLMSHNIDRGIPQGSILGAVLFDI